MSDQSAASLSIEDAKERICALCRGFYRLGWVSGTGGGISLRAGDRLVMAPSGVPKESMEPENMFELDLNGHVLLPAQDASLKLSACAPLFMHAFKKRGAGAVIHSHSINAMLATLGQANELHVTHLEMLKGLSGVGFHDMHRIPIIENTAEECDLADTMGAAMDAYPEAHAVLVRRHGVYIWGADWIAAKRHAEVYDYLFEASVRMRAMGIDPGVHGTDQASGKDAVHASNVAR